MNPTNRLVSALLTIGMVELILGMFSFVFSLTGSGFNSHNLGLMLSLGVLVSSGVVFIFAACFGSVFKTVDNLHSTLE